MKYDSLEKLEPGSPPGSQRTTLLRGGQENPVPLDRDQMGLASRAWSDARRDTEETVLWQMYWRLAA